MTDLLLTHAKLIDPEGGTVTTGALGITDGRISAIITDDSPLPEARTTVDCGRKHLGPGRVYRRGPPGGAGPHDHDFLDRFAHVRSPVSLPASCQGGPSSTRPKRVLFNHGSA